MTSKVREKTMIDYKDIGFGRIKVFLDGKMVGRIKQVDGGHQYFPMGQRVGGEVFQTVEEVKKSLA